MMNKLNFKQFLFTFTGAVLALSACKKDKLPPIDPQPNATTGIYVLCEGLFSQTTGSSASSITYFDISTSTPQKDYFKKQNGIELGFNANDLKQYGSKMYCVITGTNPADKNSYVEVMNIATGKSLKRIPFSDASKGFLPRAVAFYKNKAYVSGFDGYISKIDTANLTIESRIAVGGALDGLTIVNGKLYVANSDHPYYPNPNNSSVSVVDLNTFTKLGDIAVGFNPTRVAATAAGDIFVLTKGNYADISASLDKISSVTDKKISSNPVSLEYLNVTGTKGFVIGDYMNPYFKTLNIGTGTIDANFVTDQTAVVTPYGVTVNNLDNNVFVADANGYGAEGKLFCFSTDGKQRFFFATGALPQSAVFKYSYK
jgi:hypothetical protein